MRRARGGAGLYLIGAATRALAELGLGDAAMRAGFVNRVQSVRSQRGMHLADIDVESYWSGCGPCLGIRRAALHDLLAERIADLLLRLGVRVVALHQEPDQVSVDFSDGSGGTYDLVVGADGIRSSVRRLEFGESEPLFRGQAGWRFITPRPRAIDGWTVFLGADRAFLLVPIGDDVVYCYADRIVPHAITDPPDGRAHRLMQEFQHFAAPVRAVLEQLDSTTDVHFAPIEEVRQEPAGRGRVVLIGDAAHAMSPNMACGAAMAFADALVLLVRDPLLRLMTERTYRTNYRPLLLPPR